jgi:AcrR family transcriptional regulator
MKEKLQPSPDTAAALLRAARTEFAARGFDGASVRAITRAAGANLGAITYHFGTKQALYEAVISAALEDVAAKVAAVALRSERAPLARAGDVVRVLFEHFIGEPALPRLMLQALASREGPPPGVAAPLQRLLFALAELVREGQRDGSIRAGDATLLAISIVSNPLHLNIVRVPAQKFLQLDLADADVRERVIENAIHFVRGGLAARRGGGV